MFNLAEKFPFANLKANFQFLAMNTAVFMFVDLKFESILCICESFHLVYELVRLALQNLNDIPVEQLFSVLDDLVLFLLEVARS